MHGDDGSFWPSFTDIMMVITMIFLMATSLLVVRNWQLVAELQESVKAEQLASQLIESTVQVNATLEERLANAEQSNSILRLRMLKKDEELKRANQTIHQQSIGLASMAAENNDLQRLLNQTVKTLAEANVEINTTADRQRDLSKELAELRQQLILQESEKETVLAKLNSAKSEIEAFNQQLFALKGDYETVKSKYEELIKPARSASGKYIAEVYYIRNENGEVIRYKQQGDTEFVDLPLSEIEKRLEKLKAEKGNDLYVKIIIPQNSGLTYNEAWEFMRGLLVKYDYYYQEN